MKSEKLLEAIGQIDDGMIAEAHDAVVKPKLKPGSRPSKRRRWPWAAAVAAAACVIVAVIAVSIPEQPDDVSRLPMLTIGEDMGGYGFEGLLAYDIGELDNGNPWSESDIIETLPVFQNATGGYDGDGVPVNGLSGAELTQRAEDMASIMGLPIDSLYTNPTEESLQRQREKEASLPGNEGFEPNATPTEAVAVCGDVEIKVESNGQVRIFFEKGAALPEEYRFANEDTSEQQARDAMQYLLEEYQQIVDMKSPALALFGDYNFYGDRSFSYEAYENSGSLTDRILGYNFNWIRFAPNHEGVLWIIDRYSADLSQKIGDYPLITPEEARELLLQGRYITSVPEELPGEEYIASVELMYRTSRHDEIFMPYYRFLVELPTMEIDNVGTGLKTFGAFYVPAVEERYLTNMPLWDGSFN